MNATKWLASKLNLSIQKKITLEKTTAEAYPDAPKEFKGITISDSNVLQYVVPEAIDSKIVEKLFPKGSEDQREKLRNADIIEGGRAFFESVTTIAVESVFEALLKRSSMFYDDYIVTKGKVVADNPLHEAGFLYGSKVDLDNIKEIEVFASELVQKHARLLAKKLGKKVERFELPARKIERNAALNEFVSDVVLPVIPQLLNALKGDKDFKLSGTIDNRFPEIHFFLDGILEHLLYYKRLRRGIKRRMASDLAPIKYKIEWVKQELKNAKAKRAAKKSVKSVQKEGKE